MKESTNYLELAYSPLMWLAAAVAVGVVVIQSVVTALQREKKRWRIL